MGYYSDVMLITDASNASRVRVIFETLKGSGDPQNILLWADDPEGFEYTDYYGPYGNRTERKLIMWQWSGMRWGYKFTRTDELEKAIDEELTYKDNPPTYTKDAYAHYGIIVLGEDLEDTRLVGNPQEYGMWVDRKITWT